MMKLLILSTYLLLLQKVDAQLPNDECVDATVIPFTGSAFPFKNTIPDFSPDATYNTYDATSECIFREPSGNVWYSFEASVSGVYDFSTLGSTFIDDFGEVVDVSAYISLFKGDDCGALEIVTCGYIHQGGIDIVMGTNYFVEIGSFSPNDRAYDVVFTISESSPPPPNDECADATIIPSNPLFPYSTPVVYLTQATFTPSSDSGSCFQPGLNSVWYLFTPSVSDRYDFATIGSKLITGEGVFGNFVAFQGSTCTSLKEIQCGIGKTLGRVSLVAGVTYYIMVQVPYARASNANLTLTVTPSIPPPPNDECINAIIVDPFAGLQFAGNTSSASQDKIFDESGFEVAYPSGVWYKTTHTLPTTIPIVASTCNDGTSFDTQISVFKGDDCGNLQLVGQNDDFAENCFRSSIYQFLAAPHVTYYILVHSVDSLSTGNYTLTIEGIKNYFALIDSKIDKVIERLGSSITYFDIKSTSSSLNIEAVFANETSIRSVMVTFDNPPISLCENTVPYSVFRDTNGDFRDAIIPLGIHTVSATSYSRQGCRGRAGVSMSETFEVIGCGTPFRAYYGASYTRWTPFYNEVVIPSACNINIELRNGCSFAIDKVTFVLSNSTSNVFTKVEKMAPFFLFGNSGDIINKGNIAPGVYNLTVTIDGIKYNPIQFTISDSDECDYDSGL